MPDAVGSAHVDIRPDLSGFAGTLSRGVLRAIPSVEGGVKKAFGGVFNKVGLLATAGVTTGLAAGLVSIAKVGMDYERSMSLLRTVTGATAGEMDRAATVAKQLGAAVDLPGVSAKGAADAMTELGKAGLTAGQAMDAARGTLQLAIAAQVDEGTAASITANALQSFGLKAAQAGTVTDLLAGAANASTASMTDVAEALQQAGAVAKGAHISIQDTSTAIAMLANAGIEGSDAGTLLRTTITRLTAPTDTAKKAMKQLGLSAYDNHGNFVGLRTITAELATKLGGLSQAQKAAAIQTIFGADAQRFANIAVDQGVKVWDKNYTAVTRTGQAAELAAAQNVGLGGALDNLHSTVETVGLSLFQSVEPALTGTAKAVTGMVAGLPAATAKFGAFLSSAGKSKTLSAIMDNLRGAFGNVLSGLQPLQAPLAALFGKIREAAPTIRDVTEKGFVVLSAALKDATSVIGPVVKGFVDLIGAMEPLEPLFGGIAAAIAAYKIVTGGWAAIQWAVNAAMAAYDAVLTAGIAITWSLNTAVVALETALATPVVVIALVVAAIVGLVVGLVILYKKNEAFRNFVDKAWSSIKAAISATVDWIIGTAWPALVGAWDAIAGAASSMWNAITGAFSSAWSAFTGFLGQIVSWVASVGSTLWGIIKVITLPWRIAIGIVLAIWIFEAKLIIGAVMGIVHGVIAAWNWLVNGLTVIVTAIGAALGIAWNAVKAAVMAAVTPIVNGITAAWSAVVAFLSPILARIRSTIVGAWNSVRAAVGAAMNAVRNVIASVWAAIVGVVTAFGARVIAGYKRIWHTISSAVASALAPVIAAVISVWNKVVSTISGFASKVASTAKTVFGGIKTAATSVVSAMAGIGSDIVHGIINGITGMAGTLASAVTRFVDNNIPGPVRKLLGISSPSRVFIEIGQYVGQGFIVGLNSTAGNVRSAVSRMTGYLISAFTVTVGKGKNKKSGISQAGQQLIATISRQSQQLQALATKRAAITARLATAQSSLANVTKQAADYAANVTQGLTANVTNMGTTTAAIIENLQAHLARVQKFGRDIAALRAKGLNSEAIDQIIQSGLDTGGATATMLAQASAWDIQQINSAQAQVDKAATATGNAAAQAMFGAGIQAAKGLVAGLASQQKVLADQMRKLADVMVKEIKNALHIKSPSRVFARLGMMTGAGLAQGMHATAPKVSAASRALAVASTRGFGRYTAPSSGAAVTRADVRVFIGERELTSIVRVEVGALNDATARAVRYGRAAS